MGEPGDVWGLQPLTGLQTLEGWKNQEGMLPKPSFPFNF